MTRINVYAYPEADSYEAWAGGPQLAGWFDEERATAYAEGTYWNGDNRVSLATRSEGDHQVLCRTAGGRWAIQSWSRRQGVSPRCWFVTADDARAWLVVNEYAADAIDAALGEALPEESGPVMGRPEVGPQVKVRLTPDTIAVVDQLAAAAGVTRSAWIRAAVDAAIQD